MLWGMIPIQWPKRLDAEDLKGKRKKGKGKADRYLLELAEVIYIRMSEDGILPAIGNRRNNV